ncbi:Asp-tRNA(Asn)/Glu-tRNA(Gln) amidotransferase subunit GatA [Candidatus Gottesmanbacteria bacterium]|nr:Asp-tRNA(Asn)/Glu-tRNA(Gln) amidotransferase subunit GatA [Candidatus Gottesmanbacteria bacterium]
MNKLNQLTIKQAKDGLKEKKFSSVELTQACLDEIERVDKTINAFITVTKDYALTKAKEADQLLAQGAIKPLLGIPIAFKDLYLTRGIRTTAASRVLKDYIPQYSSTVVEKIENAGAVIIGKTNSDAWAHGSSGENSDFGSTKNPWNIHKIPGGSSSGSATAVSASCSPAAMGTDTGGSIRLPASFTNTVGLKPTYGRVSRYGVVAMASSLDTMGHFTKTVEDSALLLSVTAGKDKQDATSLDVPVPDYANELIKNRIVTIGLAKEYFSEGINEEIKSSLEQAVNKLKSKGFEIKEIGLPHTKAALAAYYIIVFSEVSSNLSRYDGIRYGNDRSYFGDEAKRRIMLGTYSLSAGYYDAYYLKASKVQTLVKQDFENAFKQVDVLIGPVSPTLPFNLGEKVNDPLSMYLSDVLTVPINLAGVPSLSVPCGFSDNNLPIGFQIIGPQLSEGLLFSIGHKYQSLTDFHTKTANI